MKLLMLSFLLLGTASLAQSQSTAENLSLKISQKLKDSLLLTQVQKDTVYSINIKLHQQKMLARQQYYGSDSLVRKYVQKVENTRDSLYKMHLTNQQFILYKEKKINLISNN